MVQEGEVTFTVGGDTIEATSDQIVVVSVGVPHKFVNSGSGLFARSASIPSPAWRRSGWSGENH